MNKYLSAASDNPEYSIANLPKEYCQAYIPDRIALVDNLDDNLPNMAKEHMMENPSNLSVAILVVCIKGTITIQIDHVDYEVGHNQTIIILPMTMFQFIGHSEDAKVVLVFMGQKLTDFSKDIKLGIEFGEQIKFMPRTTLSSTDLEDFVTIYKMLKRKLQDPFYTYKNEIAQSLMRVLGYNAMNRFVLSREIRQIEHHTSNRHEGLFKAFMDALYKDFRQERSVIYYADKLCVTPKYLSSVIFEVSGKHATEWINTLVINECKSMLSTSHYSIKEICDQLNFSNQSFFAKYFKQHTGMSPRDFRQENK